MPKVHTLTETQTPHLTNPIQNADIVQNEGVSSSNLLRDMSQDHPPLFKGKTVAIDVTDTNDDSNNDDTDSRRNLDSGSSGGSGSNSGSGGRDGSSSSGSGSGSSGSGRGSGSNSGSNGGSNSNSGSGDSGSNSGPSENSGPSSNSGPGSDEDTDTLDFTDLPILEPEDDTDTEPTVYIIDLTDYTDGEDPIVVVESNQTRTEIPNLVGNEQPIVVPRDDVSIASWWTLENQELGFESWDDLESFLVSEFGRNPPTGIDTSPGNLPFDLQIGFLGSETGEVESVVELQGTEQQNLEVVPSDLILTTSVLDCVQVLTCQRILITGLGSRNVCKNQLICPNSENRLFALEGEFPLDGEFGFQGELEAFQEILGL